MDLALYDKDFLLKLDQSQSRKSYCKIVALNQKEEPVAEITSNVASGSINVDGSSAVRRTISLSLITNDLKVDTMVWRVQTKIQVFVGVENTVDKKYEKIIWFPQGIYVIVSFNSNFGAQGYTINLQAKDKMCLLNGDVGGNLWASHDFSQLYITKSDGSTVKTYIPIYNIIREAIHTYALEPYSNIIINDLDTCGVELLEYIGTGSTMYIFKQARNAEQDNAIWTYQIAFDTNSPSLTQILDDAITDNNGVDEGARIKPNGSSVTYVVQKRIRPNDIDKVAGYRATEVTYPGELVIPVGGTINDLLSKLANLLGEFEYFYNLEGRFVFQRKKIYINTVWTNTVINENTTYYDSMSTATNLAYDFVNGIIINTFSNTPQLNQIKNDFSIWGSRKTSTGTDMQIHLRYALDNKPTIYYSLLKHKLFISTELNKRVSAAQNDDIKGVYDWRELIYQMAQDNLYSETAIASLKLALSIGFYHYTADNLSWSNRPYYKYDVQKKQFVELATENELTECLNNNVFLFGPKSNLVKVRLTAEQKEKISNIIGFDYALYQLGSPYVDMNLIPPETKNLITSLVNQYTITDKTAMLIEEIKEWQQTATTGYEAYYTDILGFWKYMYKTEPDFYKEKEGYTLTDYAQDSGQIIITYTNNSNNQTVQVYYDGNEVDFDTWQSKWSHNGFWNPELFSYNDMTDTLIIKQPTSLYFWMDFCDTSNDLVELSSYRIDVAGRRSKYINDKDVRVIYFRDTPNLLFVDTASQSVEGEENLNYCHINIAPPISNYFKISTQGKSAKEVLDALLYECTYAQENISLQTIPIYYLEPNTRIRVFDENTNINGEYIIKSFSIPLSYDGLMSISATRAAERIM